MAFLYIVRAECQRQNKKNRNVKECRCKLSAAKYWEMAAGKNFIITGGTEEQRNGILASALMELEGPVIILNGNETFEERVVEMAKQGQLTNVKVSSPRYKNYDVFSGMSKSTIQSVFADAGRQNNRNGNVDTITLESYTEAFLQILERSNNPLCLNAMFALARRNGGAPRADMSIAAIGEEYRIDEEYLRAIRSGAGEQFRNLLSRFKDAFENVTTEEEYGYSLLSDYTNKKLKGIYLIWTLSRFQDILNIGIAAELEYLLTKNERFTLIVNDAVMSRDDKLAGIIAGIKNRGNSKVGLCSQNIITWLNGLENKDVLLGNTGALMVLVSGGEDQTELKEILDRFGTYEHYEPLIGVGGRPIAIDHPLEAGAKDIRMNKESNHPKVSPDDMSYFSVAAKGHLGDTVGLYRGIAEI